MTEILKLSCASFSYVNISYVLAVAVYEFGGNWRQARFLTRTRKLTNFFANQAGKANPRSNFGIYQFDVVTIAVVVNWIGK